ncbi:MAG: SusC/RagA family TonB-linked outer membrane protein, partial [Sphingobacteriales bacterium]
MDRKLLLMISCLLLFVTAGFAQQNVVGKVTDEGGQAIPGVNVRVKGANTAVSTQADGTYSIAAQATATLTFSYLGYTTQEIAVNSRTRVDVTLSENANQLSEVVVTALGIRRSEKSLGYASQQIAGPDLTLTKEQNPLGSLAGKVAGLQVTGSSGASMGGTQKIKIRSVNSLYGSDQALIVIDGTPISNSNFGGAENGVDYGNISQDINPEDIETINILKGPAASALYGNRGQFGVVLITTKKGQMGGKLKVSLNTAYTMERVSNFLPLQDIYGVGNNQVFTTLTNGDKYVNGNDESWGPKMDGTPVRMYYSYYPQDPDFGKLTPFSPQPNNIKDFYETGQNVNTGLNISGGGINSSYRLSYNNGYIRGVVPNTSLKRNNFGLATVFKLTDKITAGANVNYANTQSQRPTQGYQGSFTGAVQWFQRNIDINRLRNYKYADGTIMNWNVNPNTTTGIITNNRPSDWNNPFFDAYEVLNNDRRDRLFGDVNLNYQVLPELKLSGFIRSDMYTQNITHKEPLGGRLVDSFSSGKYIGRENNYEFLAQFMKGFGDFTLNVNAGANLFISKYNQQFQATAGGLISPGLYTAANSIDRPVSTSYIRDKEVRSLYAMASFGYKDIYFLDASVRNDVSSALPISNNSYFYPSVSGSIIYSELLKWSPLSYGKFRASYAVAGSDLGAYQTA